MVGKRWLCLWAALCLFCSCTLRVSAAPEDSGAAGTEPDDAASLNAREEEEAFRQQEAFAAFLLIVDLPGPETELYQAVQWAWCHNPAITQGVAPDRFAPDNPCKRAYIITFIWRACGCPKPSNEDFFVDMDGLNPNFKTAAHWAREIGLLGKDFETCKTFEPNEVCTRGDVALYLWRLSGSPTMDLSKMPFDDIANDDLDLLYAIEWAVEQGVTNGKQPTKFCPYDACTRGHIVRFLSRYDKEVGFKDFIL